MKRVRRGKKKWEKGTEEEEEGREGERGEGEQRHKEKHGGLSCAGMQPFHQWSNFFFLFFLNDALQPCRINSAGEGMQKLHNALAETIVVLIIFSLRYEQKTERETLLLSQAVNMWRCLQATVFQQLRAVQCSAVHFTGCSRVGKTDMKK